MPRRRRLIRSKRLYELAIRVKEGLPFPALLTIKLIIESAMARTQRETKVILSDYLWMGNHAHMLFVALCPEACTKFYQEVQKKITESMKRLLGMRRLSMWEGDPVLAEILDIDAVIERKAYLYANPARANLVSSISQYPGASSWEALSRAEDCVDAMVSRPVPWVRQPMIKKAPGRSLSEKQDKFLHKSLIEAAGKRTHSLELYPNAWMKVFNIKKEKDIKEINERICALVKAYEDEASEKRRLEGKKLLGRETLARQAILKAHTPEKRERRVFVISTISELRKAYIDIHNEISAICAEYYRLWKHGARLLDWPPGVFIPSPGVRACALA